MSKTGWNPKPNKKLPGKSQTGKVNLDSKQFDKLILDQGVRVKVYRSTLCSNVKSIDGSEHEIDCQLCRGSNFIDRYPLETWAFIQNQSLEKMPFAEGLYDGNTVQGTFLQGVELQYFTLVELLDFTEIYYERIKRQRGNVDHLKYHAARINMLIDSTGKEYFEGSDFKLDPNGSIMWSANKGPQSGTIYSIHYEAAVQFRAIKALHSNRFAQIGFKGGTEMIKLNESWMLQKAYLVQRVDQNGQPMDRNRIRDSDDD